VAFGVAGWARGPGPEVDDDGAVDAEGLGGDEALGDDDGLDDDDGPEGARRLGWLSWPVVGSVTLAIAGLTHLVFPLGYFGLVTGDPLVGWLLIARNALVFGLFLAVVARLATVAPA